MSVFLIDSHVFYWMIYEPERIARKAAAVLSDPETSILVSKASLWELSIKIRLGKLKPDAPLQVILDQQIEENHVSVEDIQLRDIYAAAELPRIHFDPFDHLLVAQAVNRKISIVSANRKFANYPVEVIWE